MTSLLSAEDFVHLDIVSVVEIHTSTRLHFGRTQCTGACPYDDCPGDDNGFLVWPEFSKHGRHFYCRTCKRSGDIVKLIQDIKGISFSEAKSLLEIGQGKPAVTRRQPAQSEWQKKERAFLTDSYPYLRRGLQHERARAYLEQRGIPLEVAQQHGLCYIPPYKEMDEHTQDAWFHMRQWTDRLIFPLSDGGFKGRALFLWSPGMNEDEHKAKLDDFNKRVKVYNQRASVKKPEIPRWYATVAPGYFHDAALKTCEHITIVEGEFDALALLAGDIDDVVAAGRDGIRSDDIPVNVLSATLAYDSDVHGQEAARRDEKTFRRKGIRTIRCTPSEDGQVKDWSARYRLQGKEGLAHLLTTLRESDIQLCYVCGKDASASPDVFFYDEQGKLFCPECWQRRQVPPVVPTPTPEDPRPRYP
jgi:CHC2 zinc finger/Toprim domain